MGDVQFNIAKTKSGYYLSQVGVGNARLIAILVKSAGLEADGTLVDYDDVQALLAGTTDECTFTNYARKTISSVTSVVDDTNNWVTFDTADLTWTAAGGGTNNDIGAIIFAYDADITSGTDANLIPLYKMDYVETTTGVDIVVIINATGLFRGV